MFSKALVVYIDFYNEKCYNDSRIRYIVYETGLAVTKKIL